MEFEYEKTVVLISNVDSVNEEYNTLTHFTGLIPLNFLDHRKQWNHRVQMKGGNTTFICANFDSPGCT